MNTFMNILTFIAMVVVPIIIPVAAFPMFNYSLLYIIDRKEVKENKIMTAFLVICILCLFFISFDFLFIILKSKFLFITHIIIYAITFLVQFFIVKKRANRDNKLRINNINSDKEIKEWFSDLKKGIKHNSSKSAK